MHNEGASYLFFVISFHYRFAHSAVDHFRVTLQIFYFFLVQYHQAEKLWVILMYKKFIIIDVQTCLIHKEVKCTERLQSFQHIYIAFLDYVKMSVHLFNMINI